jgi:hypothetical protein
MQSVTQTRLAAIALGFIRNIGLVSHYSANCLQFIWMPYATCTEGTIPFPINSITAF